MVHALLDATAMPVNRGGVGRYLDGLIPELARLADVELSVAAQAHDRDQLLAAGVTAVAVPRFLANRAARMAWEQVGLPALARRLGAEVIHSPHYTMPLPSSVPVVVTLHDATFFSDPNLHTVLKRRVFRTATRRAVRKAAALIVPSQATRSELERLVSPLASRAIVAAHGVDTATFHPPTPAECGEVRRLLSLDERPYVAFLGTLEPRKNVPNLIRAWVRSASQRPEATTLVLAGGPGWDSEVSTALAEVPSGLRVVRAGYLPVDQLAGLLGGAAVVAYPALGEGFGLPVLEAMACGAAVLTTRRLSLPEVGGDAVAYSEVDVASLATALSALLSDPIRAEQLGRAAVARAKEFTWARSARQHAVAYEQARTVNRADGR